MLATRPLKATKFNGKTKKISKPAPHIAHVEIEIVDGAKVETAEYCIVNGGRGVFHTTKHGADECYAVNPGRGECGCEGNRRGYLCRHLRMVCALVSAGKI